MLRSWGGWSCEGTIVCQHCQQIGSSFRAVWCAETPLSESSPASLDFPHWSGAVERGRSATGESSPCRAAVLQVSGQHGAQKLQTAETLQLFTACAITLRITLGSARSVMRSIVHQLAPGASLTSRSVVAVARATVSSRWKCV